MNSSQKTWILLLLILPMCLAACTPVAEPPTATLSGGVYFDCDKNAQCDADECGIADMPIRLYYGACGENMLQTHATNEKEARGLLPAHGINPSMGPPLESSCFKGSWKETPYSELACAKLKDKH